MSKDKFVDVRFHPLVEEQHTCQEIDDRTCVEKGKLLLKTLYRDQPEVLAKIFGPHTEATTRNGRAASTWEVLFEGTKFFIHAYVQWNTTSYEMEYARGVTAFTRDEEAGARAVRFLEDVLQRLLDAQRG